MSDDNFGVAPQLLQPLAGLQTGTARAGVPRPTTARQIPLKRRVEPALRKYTFDLELK